MSLAVPVFCSSPIALLSAFCVYEATVGVFWPAIGSLRSKYIPDAGRATIMGLFRIPLNVLVCVLLVIQGWVPLHSVFSICVACLAICVLPLCILRGYARRRRDSEGLLAPSILKIHDLEVGQKSSNDMPCTHDRVCNDPEWQTGLLR